MKHTRNFKHLPARLLATVLTVSMLLSGCRQSPALRRVSYQSYQQATHLSTVTGDMDKNDTAKSGQQNQQSDKINKTVNDSASHSQTVDAQATTQVASDGSAVGTQSNSSTVTVDVGSGTGSGTGNGGSGAVTPSSESSSSSSLQIQNNKPDNSKETRTEVNLPNGTTASLPDHVTRIAAVGAAAEMVAMLSRDDASQKITVTSTEQTTGLFSQVFSNKMSGATTVWTGTTTSALGDDAFNKLVDAQPQVVICDTDNFTQAQSKTLEDNKIAKVVLPQSTLSICEKGPDRSLNAEYAHDRGDNYLASMESRILTVGTVLDGASGQGNALNRAKEFNDAYSSLVKNMRSIYPNNIGYAIQATDARYLCLGMELDMNVISQYSQFVDAYTPQTDNSSVSDDSMSFYELYCDAVNLSAGHLGLESALSTSPGAALYSSQALKNKVVNWWNNYYAWEKVQPEGPLDYKNYSVDSNHPAFWDVSDSQYYFDSKVNKGYSCSTRFYVLPDGACSWISDAPEGLLLMYWLEDVGQKKTDPTQDTVLKQRIRDFYSTYFNYSLSDDQVDEILAGPVS